MGRPSEFSQATADLICLRMSEGESLRSVCRDEAMPDKSTIFRWLAANETFRDQYARATAARADYWADEIVEISDDGSNDTYEDDEGRVRTDHDVIARSRLRVDTRKWLMARVAPKKYGDKVTQQLTGADGGPIKQEITEVRLVAVPIPERDADGYPIKREGEG